MLVVSGVNKNYFSTSSTTVYTVCVIFLYIYFWLSLKLLVNAVIYGLLLNVSQSCQGTLNMTFRATVQPRLKLREESLEAVLFLFKLGLKIITVVYKATPRLSSASSSCNINDHKLRHLTSRLNSESERVTHDCWSRKAKKLPYFSCLLAYLWSAHFETICKYMHKSKLFLKLKATWKCVITQTSYW